MSWTTIKPIDVLAILSDAEMSAYRNTARSSVTLAGNTGAGSAVITALSSTANLFIGMTATAASIPAGRVIASIDSTTQVTLDSGTSVTAATGTSIVFAEPDKLTSIISGVVNEVRGRISGVVDLGAGETLPVGLHRSACVLARHTLLTTLPIEISKDRVSERDQAEAIILSAVKGEFPLEDPSGTTAATASWGSEDRIS